MREILFKAKRVDNGEWVEGNLILSNDAEEGWESVIIPISNSDMFVKEYEGDLGFEKWYVVDKDTICQYTGLTDKNGNKIWENDVVFVTDGDGCSGSSDTGVGEIDFLMGLWYVSGSIQNGLYDVLEVIGHEAEVIGNTFDNADLLKGE